MSCVACPLHETRTNVVFGEGNPTRPLIAFVGEGPGANEDLEGKAFVGKSGKLLDKMITAMQLDRTKLYIVNVVGCRPPQNRKPTDGEMDACRGFFVGQLRAVQPRVIVTLGMTATRALLPINRGVNRMRNTWHEWEDTPVRVTVHPAYLLRNPEAKRAAWTDLKAVMARLGV